MYYPPRLPYARWEEGMGRKCPYDTMSIGKRIVQITTSRKMEPWFSWMTGSSLPCIEHGEADSRGLLKQKVGSLLEGQ